MAYLSNYIGASSKTKATRSEIEFLFRNLITAPLEINNLDYLEFWFFSKDKILSPIKKSADPNLIFQFCQKLNDIEDTQHAADLIVNKILSTQDWEVLIALYVRTSVILLGKPGEDRFGDFGNTLLTFFLLIFHPPTFYKVFSIDLFFTHPYPDFFPYWFYLFF